MHVTLVTNSDTRKLRFTPNRLQAQRHAAVDFVNGGGLGGDAGGRGVLGAGGGGGHGGGGDVGLDGGLGGGVDGGDVVLVVEAD
ncbi:hypothetical protein PInf_010079 [Phytophthora infestans]|nr:hypothetical protein PInf_010079 [Phytophthora infestans]